MALTRLPVELLEMIIEAVVPANGDFAIPTSNITTRTLHSCLTINRATFNRSLELLYCKCLYINSPRRLHALLQAYQPNSIALQLKLEASRSMFLEPFSGDTIEESEVVPDLENLFDILGNHVRRMVIDMPLRSAYPDTRTGRELRVPLRNAFRKLMALEEFVTVRDELYLSTIFPSNNEIEQPVWTRWPNLRHLALYNVDISHDLLLNIGRLRALKTLVLTRPDGMEDWERLRNSLSPETTIIVVNVWDDHQPAQRRWLRLAMDSYKWAVRSQIQASNDQDVACAQAVCVSRIDLNSGLDARHIYDCQEWVKDEMLSGTLWS